MNQFSKAKLDRNIVSVHLGWEDRVTGLTNTGNFVEAFASADALIDDIAEAVLRKKYSSHESQSLINAIHNLRGSVGFNGMAIVQLLRNEGLIEESLCSDVRKFKHARNLVLHNIEGEYKLVSVKELSSIKTQEEFDRRAKEEALSSLSAAHRIFNTFVRLLGEMHEGKPKSVHIQKPTS